MSRRLGETLISAGRITEAQLHRALTSQLVFGGHLGTSLLELGYLDEETLGETLAAMFRVPYADFDLLSQVPYSVVHTLPAKLVEKHKVVPLRVEGKTLHLAMIDPKNLLALDEISFVTGYKIVPWVCPEVRIHQVLEKYYNIPRTQRYTTLTRELSRLRSRKEKLRPLQRETPGAEPSPQAAAARAAPAPHAVAATSAGGGGSSDSSVLEHFEKYGYGRSWREVAEALEGIGEEASNPEEADTRPQPRATAERPEAPAAVFSRRAQAASPPSLPEISRRLAEADSVDEIVASGLSYVATRLPRCLFFVVKADRAVGWTGAGPGMSEPAARTLSLPIGGESSLFCLVESGRSHYLGPVPARLAAAGFYGRLGVAPPRTMLLVPILVKGRVTAYLYADGADQEILALDVPSVLSLCGRLGFAFQIIILRNKILAG